MERLEVAVRPRFSRVLPRLTGGDRCFRRRGPWLERLFSPEGCPMILRLRPDRPTGFVLVAEEVEPSRMDGPGAERLAVALEDDLDRGIDRLRHCFGLDDDLNPFRARFGDDGLLGPAIRRQLVHRPVRRPDPWEALAWAVTEQLIEYRRAAAIQRRLIRRFGLWIRSGPGEGLVTVPGPATLARAAPAELQALDLAAGRATALIRAAREITAGRIDPGEPGDDIRLLAIPNIGPWTVACLALRGRGDPDALLAGDLAQIKLVGWLTGLGRPAEIGEVEDFYARYAPFRGLAGELLAADIGRGLDGPGNRARIRAARTTGLQPASIGEEGR